MDSAFDPTGNASTRNLVYIWDNRFADNDTDDAQSAVFVVSPTPSSSLISDGQLFGNTDFRAYNINFENRAVRMYIKFAILQAFTVTNYF